VKYIEKEFLIIQGLLHRPWKICKKKCHN